MDKEKGKAVIKEKLLMSFLAALEKAYGHWGYLAGRSFVAGICVGLGATIGVALVVVILGYVFNWLGVIPVVGDFFKQLNEFINSATPNISMMQ